MKTRRSFAAPEHEEVAFAGERGLRAAEKFVRVMDDWHLDPLLGLLLPGAGDLIGGALGLYPIFVAWRRRAPKVLIARMLLNLSIDLLTGLVPVLGDVWDFFFRANSRNLDLLRSRLHQGEVRASRSDSLVLAAAVAVFLAALLLPVVLLIATLRVVFGSGG